MKRMRAEVEIELDELKVEYAKLAVTHRKGERLRSRIVKASSELHIVKASEILCDPITPKKVMSVDYKMYRDIGKDNYRRLSKWYNERYWGKGVMSSAQYNADTGQTIVSVSMDQNQPLDEQMGIIDFIPHILPSEIDGFPKGKLINVFSEDDFFYIIVVARNDIQLWGHKNKEPYCMSAFKSYRKTLEHVHLYYPSRVKDD